jgi:hypothetical protein
MPDREEPIPRHHLSQTSRQTEPVGQQPRQHHPGLSYRSGPTDLDLESL